ncbi:MAG: putative RNA polymerase sigma-D factor [Myxococcales bacterium]
MDAAETQRWERALVARMRRGDTSAFAELYREYARPLYGRVLLPRLGDAAAAEDALSETFRTVFERIDRYEDQGKGIWSWIVRIAVNKAMDMHRASARSGRVLASWEGLVAPLREPEEHPVERAEVTQEASRVRDLVRAVLSRINPRYRRAIELRILDELPREECARELDVKTGTFDVVVLRALRAFRKEWEAEVDR